MLDGKTITFAHLYGMGSNHKTFTGMNDKATAYALKKNPNIEMIESTAKDLPHLPYKEAEEEFHSLGGVVDFVTKLATPLIPYGLSFNIDKHFVNGAVNVFLGIGDHNDQFSIHIFGGVSKACVKATFEQAVKALASEAVNPISVSEANEGDAMALKMNMNGLTTIKKIGVPQHLYDWLFANDATTEYSGGELTIKAQHMGVSMIISMGHIAQVNQGTLPNWIKAKYQAELKSLLDTLKKEVTKAQADTPIKFKDLPPPTENPMIIDVKTIQGPYGLPPIEKPAYEPTTMIETATAPKPTFLKKNIVTVAPDNVIVVAPPFSWEMFNLEELQSAGLIPLSNATRLYQPVKGSTPGKRYYCVALSDVFRVGAAWSGKELSLRFETPYSWEMYCTKLAEVFADVNPHKGYHSMHMDMADETMAAKVVGAVLASLDIPWATPLPNLKVIKGKSIS